MNFKGKDIFFALIILLLIGCGSIQKYTGIFSLAFVAITGGLIFKFRLRYGTWFVICLLTACGCFAYLNPRGGLWNLAVWGAIAAGWATRKHDSRLSPESAWDSWLCVLCVCLAVLNTLGLIFKNPTTIDFRILGWLSLTGGIGLCWFAQSRKPYTAAWTIWLKTLGWSSIFLLFSAFNQKYILIPFNLPFLPLRIDQEYGEAYGTTNASGSFGVGELMGEFQLLCGIIFLTILLHRSSMNRFKLKYYWVLLVELCCTLNIILANSRSCLILLGLVAVILPAINLFRKQRSNLGIGIVGALLLAGLLYTKGEIVNWDNLTDAYAKVGQKESFNIENVLNGQAINRGLPFEMGYARLFEENWHLGYGFGTGYSNLWAWTGNPDGYSPFFDAIVVDSHSLYLCLVPIFGWVGAVIFVLILCLTLLRTCQAIFNPFLEQHFRTLAVAFFCVWLCFLIDEYKINILRCNNYLLLMWLFLGLSHSLCRMGQKQSTAEKQP